MTRTGPGLQRLDDTGRELRTLDPALHEGYLAALPAAADTVARRLVAALQRERLAGVTASAQAIDLPDGPVAADPHEPDRGAAGLQVVGEHVGHRPAEPGAGARVQVVALGGEPFVAGGEHVGVGRPGQAGPPGVGQGQVRHGAAEFGGQAGAQGGAEVGDEVQRRGGQLTDRFGPAEPVPPAGDRAGGRPDRLSRPGDAGEPFALQRGDERLGDRRLIFDQQDSHGPIVPAATALDRP